MSGPLDPAGPAAPVAADVLAATLLEHRGRLVAWLAALTRDLAGAEDAVSEAALAALRTWPARGVPDRPQGWLATVARRAVLDAARHTRTATRLAPDLVRRDDALRAARRVGGLPDRRLELLLVCTHPAIHPSLRAPLMLQAVLGLDAQRIASVYLVPSATMAQRLVRAKAKIRAAGIPFEVPEPQELATRVGSILDAVYGAYTLGWDDAATPTAGPATGSGDLAAECVHLADLLVGLLPGDAEAHGLLALILHAEARRAARRRDGVFVPLAEQDVSRWDAAVIARADAHLREASRLDRLGPLQLQAAVQSVHNARLHSPGTDWAAVVRLYRGVVAFTPTVGAWVALAAALLHAEGAPGALALLESLPADRVEAYQPYWVVHGEALREVGRTGEAGLSHDRALALTRDPATRAHLLGRSG